MGLKMKNFNIFGVHRKIQFLGAGFLKNQYRWGDCIKRGAWPERRGWYFWGRGGVDTPMHAMNQI